MENRIAQWAERLRTAEEHKAPIDPLREEIGADADGSIAYAIQQANVAYAVSQGRRIVGRKIGLTSPAVQKQLGVDQPDFGTLFADIVFGDDEEVPMARTLQPKVEAEVALVLASDLPRVDTTLVELIAATAYVMPAIEIVGSRIANWNIRFAGAPVAFAQSYPTKTVRIIVPYTPGGPSDMLARLLASKLQESWKQPVIVENKPGASGAIGTDYVVKQPADGYAMVVSDLATLTIGPTLYKLPYDVERDLQPVSMLTSSPYYVTVNPGVPIHDLQDLVAYSKAHPTKLNYATAGMGTGPHMAGLLFATRMGLQWTYIPSKGGSQATQDVVSGQNDLMFNSAFSSSAFVKTGKLRLIGVSTPMRDPAFPNVPALAEMAPGYNTGAYQALFMRAGTPADIVAKVNADVVRVLSQPDVKEKLASLGANPAPGTVEALRKTVREDRERWANLVKDQNIKVEQ